MSVYGGPHMERLDPTNIQCALCEEVRGAAAHAFQVLQDSIRACGVDHRWLRWMTRRQ